MKTTNVSKKKHIREGRLVIVAELYKRGWSISRIAEEVRTRLNMTCSTRTVWNDIRRLLAEWREVRIKDMDACLQLELERIDDAVRELWEQWEKSKTDWTREYNSRTGVPKGDGGSSQGGAQEIQTVRLGNSSHNVVALGNPAYIAEIRAQLAERRKLLGLYAPEKKDVSGQMSFAQFLVESGALDDAEKAIATEGASEA